VNSTTRSFPPQEKEDLLPLAIRSNLRPLGTILRLLFGGTMPLLILHDKFFTLGRINNPQIYSIGNPWDHNGFGSFSLKFFKKVM